MPTPLEFFDLNLPYSGAGAGAGAAGGASRDARLRSVVALLELGYSGAAFNVSLRGVVSDKDRCAIAPFPLSSLLAAAPTLAVSASFHRRLLSVSDAPTSFRQLSRVTVSVESVSGACSVGSSLGVLRGYDVVAVRPLSQSALEHVCRFSEADVISIDLSQKLPFRLKQQWVKLAVKRGLFFEISYSHLLAETASAKRQLLCDAKLLAEWTRGHHLILSSAASDANQVRGPLDVSNLLSFLLGLSQERAQAALSHNCRSLLTKALRKKHFYKETIRIDRMPTPSHPSNFDSFWVADWIKWDPLSSAQGDLPSLQEIAKASSSLNPNASNPNIIKPLHFHSLVHEKPFLLSQYAHNLHEIQPLSPDREETHATQVQIQQQQTKASYFNDHDIPLDPAGSTYSHGTLHNKMEFPKDTCNSANVEHNSASAPDDMQLDDQLVLLKECDLPGHASHFDGTLHNRLEVPLNRCSFEKDNSAPDEIHLDDQVALSKECELSNDDITTDPGGPNQSDETVHNNVQTLLKECSFQNNNSTLLDGHKKQLYTKPDDIQSDIEVPLNDNSHDLGDTMVQELDAPFIQSEYGKDHNAPDRVLAPGENKSPLSYLFDKVYAETKKIDQVKGESANNRDAIVETMGVEGGISETDLIDDKETQKEKSIDDQERGIKIIRFNDTGETIDSATSTSSSISLMDAVFHDLGGKQHLDALNLTQGPSCSSNTKGKRKHKGLPLYQPRTMSFQGPFKHMFLWKKLKR